MQSRDGLDSLDRPAADAGDTLLRSNSPPNRRAGDREKPQDTGGRNSKAILGAVLMKQLAQADDPGARELAAGDRIMFLRNEKSLGVKFCPTPTRGRPSTRVDPLLP